MRPGGLGAIGDGECESGTAGEILWRKKLLPSATNAGAGQATRTGAGDLPDLFDVTAGQAGCRFEIKGAAGGRPGEAL